MVIVVQVHGAVDKEDLIMMGEGNNDMEEQIDNKQSVLVCYPEFSTCSQKLLPAYFLWTAFMHRKCFGAFHLRDACVKS
jgi:hypothetical protein